MINRLNSGTTWVNRWEIESPDSGKLYIVAQKADGSFGCDCPAWKFKKADANGRRPDCKHILCVKQMETTRREVREVEKVSDQPVILLQTKRRIKLA